MRRAINWIRKVDQDSARAVTFLGAVVAIWGLLWLVNILLALYHGN